MKNDKNHCVSLNRDKGFYFSEDHCSELKSPLCVRSEEDSSSTSSGSRKKIGEGSSCYLNDEVYEHGETFDFKDGEERICLDGRIEFSHGGRPCILTTKSVHHHQEDESSIDGKKRICEHGLMKPIDCKTLDNLMIRQKQN